MNNEKTFIIQTQRPVSIAEICRAVSEHHTAVLDDEARTRIVRCRRYLDRKLEQSTEPVYGINTGFGSLCNVSVSNNDLATLQKNLVMSHACGVGDPVPDYIVRTMLLLKAQSLSYGNSGVQLETVQRLIDFFNLGITPVVYSKGSLGASGDLAPLANMCLPLLGLGEVNFKGRTMPAGEALAMAGLSPVELQSKEGLALLNGTQFMSAHAVWAVHKAINLVRGATYIAAMSLDAFDGRIEPFGPQVNTVRNHRGQIDIAADMRTVLEGSEIISSPKAHVQDPYSFRCIPQVHGAVLDAVRFVKNVITDEINAPTDNPTIFPEDDIIVSAGNFHGEPIAMPMDYLALALTELSSISERRIYKLISGARQLPSFLVAKPGLNSGFMIPQYAAAGVVNQNKSLCWPASCDTIPSSQGQEDHVSMGANSATKLLKVVQNTTEVLGIELLTAAQALEFRRPLKSSPRIESLHANFRSKVPFVDVDTVMYTLMHKAINFVDQCTF